MGLYSRGQGPDEQQVIAALSTVKEPELGRDLVSLKMVQNVRIQNGDVQFTIELTTPACPLKDQIHAEAEAAVMAIPGVQRVQIEFTANVRPRGGIPEASPIPGVAHVIAVAAGKGGVGKSTVAVNLAIALAQEGASVGLIDADIYGPSVPLMIGNRSTPKAVEIAPGKVRMIPVEAYGIKAISVGLLIDESQPVIWRGPMVSQLLRQFLYEVHWEQLDYLIIDMPPGTGDIPLTLAQALASTGLTGVVTVTTPQAVATADVLKAMEMFKKLNVPLLGIIENMAYFVAPDTGTRYDIFGTGGAAQLAERLDVPLLGQIPIGMSVRIGGDTGQPAALNNAPDAYRALFRTIARNLAARVSVLSHA